MAVLETSHVQARRQQWLTWLIGGGLFLTALAVALAYWISTNHQRKVTPLPPSPAVGVNQQLSGYTFTRSDQGRPVFTIHAARTVAYQGGKSTTLEDVRVEIYGRKGDAGDVLRTDRCQYNPQSGDFLAAGPVQIALRAHSGDVPGSGLRGKQRVDIETSKLSYHQNSRVAETDEPVKFRMGTASGTAKGMTYAISDGGLELKHDVAVDWAQETQKSPAEPVHLTAATLRYDREHGTLAFSGPVAITQGRTRASSDHADVLLGPDKRLSRIILEGNARTIEASPFRSVEVVANRMEGGFDPSTNGLKHVTADGNVRAESKSEGNISHLAADHADLDLQGKQPQPIQGVAKGNVRLDGESQPVVSLDEKTNASKSMERKTLAAGEVKVAFRPDTHGPEGAETIGPGTLTISPTNPKTGEKVIKAGQFFVAFDPHSRIHSLHGASPTEVLIYPPASESAGAPPAESHADLLDAAFDPNTGTLRSMQQTGNFQYVDGDRMASANEAHYDALTQTLTLAGHPQVWDSASRIYSQKMSIDMRTNTAVCEGKVRAYQEQSPATSLNSMHSAPLPTNVLADKAVANQQNQTIHYEGHVRAWNGTDVLESPSLDVYRTERRVATKSHVVTSFMQSSQPAGGEPGTKHPAAEPHPVTIRADSLDYLDEGRRARYLGNVRLTSQDMTLDSDQLDVYLTPAGTQGASQVDHAEAEGHVKVTEPGRTGTANHAEYFAGAGKIILTGGPPLLVDEKRGSTTGQSLTFFVHDDRLFVDGGAQSPSVTKHRVAP